MKNNIKLNQEETDIINEIISKNDFLIKINKVEDGQYILELGNDEASKLSEAVKDAYTFEGFDINYKLTKKGKTYESLIDKFVELGW